MTLEPVLSVSEHYISITEHYMSFEEPHMFSKKQRIYLHRNRRCVSLTVRTEKALISDSNPSERPAL